MNLIAFTGRAGAGKSTATEVVVERFGFARISFATPIREMLAGLGLTPEELSLRKTEPVEWLGGKTPRELMQTLGTEWGRDNVHPDIWVRAAERRIQACLDHGAPGVVIDDCRFDNEAVAIKRAGGLVIGIERAGLATMQHASEAGVDHALVDFTIRNDGDEPLLRKMVEILVRRYVP